ncbi:hypothetical protein HWV23_05220 [Natronomonas halophila]|uniref:hypothetical protein n=1 Tax=Natronomonas halophila TaxID=2747817 RepID=UPI0015B590AE|nr:hypothetical protein [Natronomonas halophila]QLD85147.1 hypothetical protein HWV23_05220 [Natronomonas halophila]
MDDSTVRRIRLAAAVLALVVAGIHLLHPSHGGHALVVYAAAGYLGDPRPLLFTLGGFALVFGVLLGYNGFAGRRLYLAGVLVVLPFFAGYAAWHTLLDHGSFWPYIEAHGTHDENPIPVVLAHLRVERLALVSKVAELGVLACLVTLYRTDQQR